MDFVASRAAEKQSGWRNRVSQFLQGMGVTVFDPWLKPDVRGLHEYGREDAKSGERIRRRWTYAGGRQGAQARTRCASEFWETLHVEKLNQRLPRKWDSKLNRFVPDDDWLLWDFRSQKIRGKHVESVRK
jgi:hypothetical protein